MTEQELHELADVLDDVAGVTAASEPLVTEIRRLRSVRDEYHVELRRLMDDRRELRDALALIRNAADDALRAPETSGAAPLAAGGSSPPPSAPLERPAGAAPEAVPHEPTHTIAHEILASLAEDGVHVIEIAREPTSDVWQYAIGDADAACMVTIQPARIQTKQDQPPDDAA